MIVYSKANLLNIWSQKMKNIIALLLFAGLLLSGCLPDSSITGPEETQKQLTWVETQVMSSLSVERSFFAFKVINGADGGEITLDENYNSPQGTVSVDAKLTIPENSFSGVKIVRYLLNDKSASVTFGPHMAFSQDLTFDMRIEGIDLSQINDPSEIVFAYLDGGNNIVPCQYESITVDVVSGVVEVNDAKIDHFSRYGFAK